VPTGTDRNVTIYNHSWDHLTAEERNDPQWSPDNDEAWTVFFVWQRADRRATYDGNDDPSYNYIINGRRQWWSAPGRILVWVLRTSSTGTTCRCRCRHDTCS
jgi:hypothetical protein